MISDPDGNDRTLRAWADQLACPACRGALVLENLRIVCSACGRAYPVEDGIAVLLAERASASGSR